VATIHRKLLLVSVALVLVAADLIEKSVDGTEPFDFHRRSATWAAGSILIVVVALALAHLRSRAIALSAGMLAGGVSANLASAAAGHGLVPNPIVLGNELDGIAFNLADVFTVAGLVALTVALSAFLVRNRLRLLPPRAWERALWRRLGL